MSMIPPQNELTHLASDRLDANGELIRLCDGKIMSPMGPEYTQRSEPLKFCEICRKMAVAFGGKG